MLRYECNQVIAPKQLIIFPLIISRECWQVKPQHSLHFLKLRYFVPNFVKPLISHPHIRQVCFGRSIKGLFALCIKISQFYRAFTMGKRSYTRTHLLRSSLREPQRRRESEYRAPDKSTPVAGIHSKPPSDKWHNERAAPNVRAS